MGNEDLNPNTFDSTTSQYTLVSVVMSGSLSLSLPLRFSVVSGRRRGGWSEAGPIGGAVVLCDLAAAAAPLMHFLVGCWLDGGLLNMCGLWGRGLLALSSVSSRTQQSGWGGNLFQRFCAIFSGSSTGCPAVLQLPCCQSRQGELSENI